MRTVRPLVLLLALLALALFAAGCGDDDKGDSKDSKTTTEHAEGDTTSDTDSDDGTAETGDEDSEDSEDAESYDKTFSIELKDGEVKGGPQAMKVKSGDSVQITVKSDTDDEVHLHGIDIEAEVGPGKEGEIEFTAKDQGSYELEGHESGIVLGTVEVS